MAIRLPAQPEVVHRVVVAFPGQFRERHQTACGISMAPWPLGRESRREAITCAECLEREGGGRRRV